MPQPAKLPSRLHHTAYVTRDQEKNRQFYEDVIGLPLLTRNTVNAGFQVHQPLGGGVNGVLRLDYQMIGRTWWDPYNLTSRDPVNLLDLRAGVEADRWSVTAWSKNLTNKIYNAEFSPGGFLWRALPRQYGVEFGYRF